MNFARQSFGEDEFSRHARRPRILDRRRAPAPIQRKHPARFTEAALNASKKREILAASVQRLASEALTFDCKLLTAGAGAKTP